MEISDENKDKQIKYSGLDVPFAFEYEDGDEIVTLVMGNDIDRVIRRKKEKSE